MVFRLGNKGEVRWQSAIRARSSEHVIASIETQISVCQGHRREFGLEEL